MFPNVKIEEICEDETKSFSVLNDYYRVKAEPGPGSWIKIGVEGDILTGTCFVGLWDVWSMRWLVLTPLVIYISIGSTELNEKKTHH